MFKESFLCTFWNMLIDDYMVALIEILFILEITFFEKEKDIIILDIVREKLLEILVFIWNICFFHNLNFLKDQLYYRNIKYLFEVNVYFKIIWSNYVVGKISHLLDNFLLFDHCFINSCKLSIHGNNIITIFINIKTDFTYCS